MNGREMNEVRVMREGYTWKRDKREKEERNDV